MSSDGYFDSDDLDSDAFEQLDAIEAAQLSPGVQPAHPPLPKERSFNDLTFDIDDAELQRIDEFIEDAYKGRAQPVAGPSTSTSTGTRQTTLFGDILPAQLSSTKPRSQIQRTKSTPRNPFGKQAPKTKQWDQTEFARSGLKRGKSKGKGKVKFDDEEEDEEESVEFEQFPAPFVSRAYLLL
jgi:ATP-dependent DNA helicase MPH1